MARIHKDYIETRWYIEDVQSVRPDLDDNQSMEVLKAIADNHDATIGINWDVIEDMANDMFGDIPESEGGI